MVHDSTEDAAEDFSLLNSLNASKAERNTVREPRVSNHFLVEFDMTGKVKYKVTSVTELIRKLKWVKLVTALFLTQQTDQQLNILFKGFFGDFRKCLNSEIIEQFYKGEPSAYWQESSSRILETVQA